MVKPINWSGMLEPYLQPLKERLGILPLGQYEDGSVRLAWPGLLADPVQHGMRAAETPIPPVNDDEAWASKSRDFFDAAGLATTGALGANMAGGMVDNALGSAGAKLTASNPDLPMDLASRMARAREMGFDTETVLYRGGFGRPSDEMPLGTGSQSTPTAWFTPSKEEAAIYQDVARLQPEAPADGVPLMTDAYVKPGKQFVLDRSFSYGRDKDGNLTYDPRYFDDVLRTSKMMGYDSVKFQDVLDMSPVPHDQVAVFDNRNIRSTSAAFDPAKSDSANLLAANAKSGAAVPLSMEAQGEQDQQTLTAANILKLLRGQ